MIKTIQTYLTKVFGITLALVLGFTLVGQVNAQVFPEPFVFMAEQPTMERPAILAGQMQTIQVDAMNLSPDRSFDTTICATDIVGQQTRHLGCLPDVHLDPRETISFEVPRVYAIRGNHYVKFSYQDPDTGNWHGVLSSDASPVRADFTVQ